MGCVHSNLTQPIALIAVVLALAVAVACDDASESAVSPSCAEFEVVEDRSELIGRDEAEQLAVERLAMSAPEVTATEVERVWASCLTTYRSYQERLLPVAWTDPELRPPDMPVWIVEVKGISRPAGISAANADNPYRYAMDVQDAKTGEFMEGTRRREHRLQPAPGE